MVKPEIRKVIENVAAKYQIDPDLVEAFCMVESSGNSTANRFEPGFYQRYILPMLQAKAISPEEAKGRATSYGLMQIMGEVAREYGFKGEFDELYQPETGLEMSLLHLSRFIKKYAPDLDSAIASYNAGSPRKLSDGTFVNQVYVDKIHGYLKQIKEA